MRLGILIRDAEYRDALAKKLSSYDNDIFVNILDGTVKDTRGSIIVTDIKPGELDKGVLKAISGRTVFLTDSSEDISDSCHCAFKYGSVAGLVSELSLLYNERHGPGPGRRYASRIISAVCETDLYAAQKCLSLARQIIYRFGGRVLVLPLSYINDYGTRETGKNTMSRLLYSIETGRERDPYSFTYTDSYGVSNLLLPPGRNPMAYLNEEELRCLISGLSTRFDTVICDIGTCFRDENVLLMKESDSVILFGTGRRITGLDETLGNEAFRKVIEIKLTGETDEAAEIDDCISRIYGTGNGGNEQS